MSKGLKYPLYFLFPAAAIYVTFFIAPTLSSFYYSMTDWHIDVHQVSFVGFENFVRMFSEDVLLLALKNTVLLAIMVTLLQNLFGLLLALALNEKLKLAPILRAVFYMPQIICPLVIGYVFTALLNPEMGLVNMLLRSIGLDFLALDWLSDPNIAFFSIMATEVWRVTGFAMIIYLAGLQTIPTSIIEYAQIDGAGYWSRFRHIVFPLIAPAVTINFLLSVINSLKVFEIVLVLTRGGPGYSTEVFNTYIMRHFGQGEYGYSTAVNVVLFFIISTIGLAVLSVLRKREVDI
jgi:raffinose/stachyose/melibiose transport system permease protein